MSIPLPSSLDLYFDGACEPRNPGGTCSYGWAIAGKGTSKVLAEDSGISMEKGTPLSTCNYAEWAALIYGLQYLEKVGWKGDLRIYGDSVLIVNQVNARWRCHKEHLLRLRNIAWKILIELGNVFIAYWIPRNKNKYCDYLSKHPRGKAEPLISVIDVDLNENIPLIHHIQHPSKLSKKQRKKMTKKEKRAYAKETMRRCLHCKKNQPRREYPYCRPCIEKILHSPIPARSAL